MRFLVTGGAGFIGANHVRYLLENHPEAQVVCLDALTYAGNLETLADVMDTPRFRFIHGDISDKPTVDRVFAESRPEAVINFAAETHVDRSILDPGIFTRTNVVGTHILLEACRTFGGVRFHQVSTDEVYGDLPLDRPDLLFSEETPIHASSPYSASKAAADLMVLAYFRTFGAPVTVSRCSNNYGPYQFPEKLIPLVILRAITNEPIPVYGTGENIRDWLYVEDHCAAIDRIVRKGRIGEVYNIGGHNEHSNLDVIRIILGILGKPESLIQFVSNRPGHDMRYAIDAAKIGGELGWEPATGFERGIQRTVRWYIDHPAWWERIVSGEYRRYIETQYGNR